MFVGIEQYISGVIFFEETLNQSTADGTSFPSLLRSKGILVGIKVRTSWVCGLLDVIGVLL